MIFITPSGKEAPLKILKSLKALVRFFFETSKYWATRAKDGQVCPNARYRSIEDCFEFCNSHRKCNINQVARIILDLCAKEEIAGMFCYEIKRFVFGNPGDFDCDDPHHGGIYKERFGWDFYYERGLKGVPMYLFALDLDKVFKKYLHWFADLTDDPDYYKGPD
jgi:hypothetical protein